MSGRHAAILVLLAILAPLAAADQVVVNSQDWRDVYSGLHYAAVTDQDSFFVIDAQHGPAVLRGIPRDEPVILITGRQQAMPGFRALLQSSGITISEEISSRDAIDTNHELALRAPTRHAIVVDDGYGYAAISVANYAKLRGASVLFASDDTAAVLEEKDVESVLLYGHIPAEIYEELSAMPHETINHQDRFEDNFALVERFNSESPQQSILLSNGEFIERQVVSDTTPVLFTGRQNVPDDVISFLNDGGFRVGVLVGNALAPNAQYIKDRTGMSIFIKFAQGSQEQQMALDLFPIPTPNPLLTIRSADYDPSSQALIVTYQNPGEVTTYLMASYTSQDGTFEDSEPIFLDGGTYKTVSYPMPQPEGAVSYVLLYGAYPNSLELLLQGEVEPAVVDISDRSAIRIAQAVYATGTEEFRVAVENIGPVDTYVLLEASDVKIGQDSVRLSSGIERIRSGGSKEIVLSAALTERDIRRNQELSLEAFYGEREFSLVKRERAAIPVEVVSGSFPLPYLALAALVAAVLVWFVTRRSKRRGPAPF